jgi:hypothetical protein
MQSVSEVTMLAALDRVLCPHCKGAGERQVVCDCCGGTGEEVCDWCRGGSHQFADWSAGPAACHVCFGAGHRECSACQGRGCMWEKCLACGGTGCVTGAEAEKARAAARLDARRRARSTLRAQSRADAGARSSPPKNGGSTLSLLRWLLGLAVARPAHPAPRSASPTRSDS